MTLMILDLGCGGWCHLLLHRFSCYYIFNFNDDFSFVSRLETWWTLRVLD